MTDPPEGYLGAGARISRGPAPELVEAGYELELADAEVRAEYERLLGLACSVRVLPRLANKEESYFEAGRQVVRECELLVAIWDGLPARGLGGTGDVVAYARTLARRIVHIDPVGRMVTGKS